MSSFDDLPQELLRYVLESADLAARDLASLEATCFHFRSPCNQLPNRRASLLENTAHKRSRARGGPWRMCGDNWMELLKRCGSRWARVLNFIELVEQGRGQKQHFPQVVAARNQTLLVNAEGSLLVQGLRWEESPPLETEPSTFHIYAPTACFGGTRVASVAAGRSHVAVLDCSMQVYTFGDDIDGCCGHGQALANTCIIQPKIVEGLIGIPCKQVSAGDKHTIALTVSGRVYTWGAGIGGRLGNGSEENQATPGPVTGLETEPVLQVAAGRSHNLLLAEAGTAYSFGCGYRNQLGHGPVFPSPENVPRNELEPRKIMSFLMSELRLVAVAAGDENSAVIDTLGQVYTWGDNYCGALGHGHEDLVTCPKVVKGLKHELIVQVSMKKRKSLFLTASGKVYGSGWGGTGALGLGTSLVKVMEPKQIPDEYLSGKVVQVSTGWYHSALVLESGHLKGFGDGINGPLWTSKTALSSSTV